MTIQRVSMINSNNTQLNSDFDFQKLWKRVLGNKGGIESNTMFIFDNDTKTLSAGEDIANAYILCTRTTSSPIPNQKFLAQFEFTGSLEFLNARDGDKIFIEIKNDLIEDATLIEDLDSQTEYSKGLGIGEIKIAQEYPQHSNYLPLYEITSGGIIDMRVFIFVPGEKIDKIKLSKLVDEGGQPVEIVTKDFVKTKINAIPVLSENVEAGEPLGKEVVIDGQSVEVGKDSTETTVLLASGSQYNIIKNVKMTASKIGNPGACLLSDGGTNPESRRLTPTMTSNSQEGWEVSSSSIWGMVYDTRKAFNKTNVNSNDCRHTGNGIPLPQRLKIKSPNKKIIKKYKITARNNDGNISSIPKDWQFQGSNDGVTWDTLDTQSNIIMNSNETREFSLNNTEGYIHYRIYISSSRGGENGSIAEFDIFGCDYMRTLTEGQQMLDNISANLLLSTNATASTTDYWNVTIDEIIYGTEQDNLPVFYGTGQEIVTDGQSAEVGKSNTTTIITLPTSKVSDYCRAVKIKTIKVGNPDPLKILNTHTWGLIPPMNTDSLDGWTVSGINTGNNIRDAVRNEEDEFTVFSNPSSSNPSIYTIQAPGPIALDRYGISANAKDWQFQGSNDGVTWDTLDTQSNIIMNQSSKPMTIFYIKNKKSYQYYRYNITKSNNSREIYIYKINIGQGIYNQLCPEGTSIVTVDEVCDTITLSYGGSSPSNYWDVTIEEVHRGFDPNKIYRYSNSIEQRNYIDGITTRPLLMDEVGVIATHGRIKLDSLPDGHHYATSVGIVQNRGNKYIGSSIDGILILKDITSLQSTNNKVKSGSIQLGNAEGYATVLVDGVPKKIPYYGT